MTLTKSARDSLAARLKEHSEADLIAMVEWVTGCRCGARTCRACSHLQPGGYANPQTYLRPDNCATYIDLAAQALAPKAAEPRAELDKADDPDKAWALVASMVTSRERRDIVGYDAKHTQTIKFAIKAIGGRDVIAANLGNAKAAWPRVWTEARAEIKAKLEAMR